MTTENTDDIIIYQSPDGTTSLDVRLDHETVWLTQKQMAELFAILSACISAMPTKKESCNRMELPRIPR